MTEVRISVGTAQSSGSTPVGTGGLLAYSLRLFVKISVAAANFLRSRSPGSVEGNAKSGGAPDKAESGSAAETPESAGAAGEIESGGAAAEAPLAADGNVDGGPEVKVTASFVPDQQEIERRRDLVRMLFNDFWNGAAHKPAGFAQRLDQAEDYLNARLATHGEAWRLDANTRTMLGLPPRSSLPV